jgi:hypothetical protein
MQIILLVQKIGEIIEEPAAGIRPKHLLVNQKGMGGRGDAVEITHKAAAESACKLSAHLHLREEPMLTVLPLGHAELVQRMKRVDASPLDGKGPLVRLHAEVEARQDTPPGAGQRQGATTTSGLANRRASKTARRYCANRMSIDASLARVILDYEGKESAPSGCDYL